MINTTRLNPMESGRISKCLFNGGYVSFSTLGVPRFLKQDMMAEKYYYVSPYMYCLGNPVRFIDPDGMDWYSSLDSVGCKNGIFIHRTNRNGTANGTVSIGCHLIKASQMASFEKHVGRNPYKVILRRK